jgi:hypothetical protein
MSEYKGHVTMTDGSHMALSEEEAKALWEMSERSAEDRARLMPTSDDAMQAILDAHQRMKALGWRKGIGIIGVKRGDECAVREDGSTGIWSGWVDEDGKYAHYCDCVSRPSKVWLKPLAELTEDERTKMAECDKSDREFNDRMVQSLIASSDFYNDGNNDE